MLTVKYENYEQGTEELYEAVKVQLVKTPELKLSYAVEVFRTDGTIKMYPTDGLGGETDQTLYVMNDKGKTVATWSL